MKSSNKDPEIKKFWCTLPAEKVSIVKIDKKNNKEEYKTYYPHYIYIKGFKRIAKSFRKPKPSKRKDISNDKKIYKTVMQDYSTQLEEMNQSNKKEESNYFSNNLYGKPQNQDSFFY
jgi:hypothetical protein